MTLTFRESLPPDDHRGRAHPAPPTVVAPPREPAGRRRDPALDLLRFACLVVVVILHSMMSAAVLGPDGAVVPTVALSDTTGFAAASWLFQVMPLFFIIGGASGFFAWRRIRASGGTWADYLRARLRRLVAPVTVLIALAGIGLSAAAEIGVPTELITEASHRIGQPLWFLAVYVGLTALVPVAVHVHDTAPRRALAVLAGAVIVVDALVAVTGVSGLGYLNFLLVWPLIQQLGFFCAESLDRPVRRAFVWPVLAAALLVLAGLVASGVYSPNMLINLNPPTGALVLLGVVQMCGLRLLHARLNRALTAGGGAATEAVTEAAAEPRILRAQIWRRVIAWGNRYGMEVYLWHMSVVIVLIGELGALAQTVSGLRSAAGPGIAEFVLPEIGSAWWWATRPVWLLAVMLLSALLAMAVNRIPFPTEQRLTAIGRHIPVLGPRARAVTAVGAATTGIAIALLVGIAPLGWTLTAVLLLMGALILAAGLSDRPGVSAPSVGSSRRSL